MTGPKRIAEFAMIGDMRTGALIGPDGAIEWFCLPRFDNDALFAALLGDDANGAWHLRASDAGARTSRRYEPSTMILETHVEAASGSAKILDFMPIDAAFPTIVRIVEGISGRVEFRSRVAPRMKYGLLPPWSRFEGDGWIARAAPDGLCLHASVALHDDDRGADAQFSVVAGERVHLVLQWFPAMQAPPAKIDVAAELERTRAYWTSWVAQCTYEGPHRDLVVRSAIALKALSSNAHGSFVAALTTSLPERIGGEKNWDYRYTWLRDASFATQSLLRLGFRGEARAWRDWFVTTTVGRPDLLHIMYGVDGGMLADESDLPWLAGFARSSPVRLRNDAHTQFQLGVYGDVIASFEHAQREGVVFDREHWELVVPLLEHLERVWQRTGNGIWERRGGKRHYVASKLMVWVALDRAIKMAERGALALDTARWTTLRDCVREEICRLGFDPTRKTFTQYYGSIELDASALLLFVFDFLPPEDERMIGTIAAIERELMADGFVYRYTADGATARTETTEGAFIMCGFWLVQALARTGRRDDATALFDRLAGTATGLGLLAEEYAVHDGFAIGNYPQAFSHAGLIDAACVLANAYEPEVAAVAR